MTDPIKTIVVQSAYVINPDGSVELYGTYTKEQLIEIINKNENL